MTTGAVSGSVRAWLRVEGLAVLLVATWLYVREGHGWIPFALLFFSPDVGFVGYLAGPRAGAVSYNAAHSYIGPLTLAAAALAGGTSPWLALIWGAHIGFDRALGYGLKYPTGFFDTHLGRMWRSGRA